VQISVVVACVYQEVSKRQSNGPASAMSLAISGTLSHAMRFYKMDELASQERHDSHAQE